jgi:hypothetical protein
MTSMENVNLGTPIHVVLLKITMWTVLFLGLLGVMVVYMLN